MLPIITRISKRIGQPESAIVIDQPIYVEDSNVPRSLVHYRSNQEVDGSESHEYAGYVINNKFYCAIANR